MHDGNIVLVFHEHDKDTEVIVGRDAEQLVIWGFQLRPDL